MGAEALVLLVTPYRRRRKGSRQLNSSITHALPDSSSRVSRLSVAAFAFVLGTALVFVAGFAQPDALHDAAHDTRHAMSFPCH